MGDIDNIGDIDKTTLGEDPRAPQVIVRVADRIADIPADDWNACAVGVDEAAPGLSRPTNPFVSHAFLLAIEESGSASRETGWLPQHLLYEDSGGRLLACLPCYLKSHSQGEYVFDHGWAEAFMRAGGRYYPKLQSSVPFTPVPGPRLLSRAGPDLTQRRVILLQAGRTLAAKLGVSSLHITFMTREEWDLAGQCGYLQRTDQQFHWRNEGYGSFDDFLATLTARKRKAIKRERRAALDSGLELEWVTGRNLTEAHWDSFYAFYMNTGARKWGRPYLTREAFSRLGETMTDALLLVLAKRAGAYVAGALNFIGANTLYGRYWGATEMHNFLHFEVCYYQAIEYAIHNGLMSVEAGAQGGHKLARGYLPVETYSAHFIADPELRRAVADYLDEERRAVTQEAALLESESPYKHEQR